MRINILTMKSGESSRPEQRRQGEKYDKCIVIFAVGLCWDVGWLDSDVLGKKYIFGKHPEKE